MSHHKTPTFWGAWEWWVTVSVTLITPPIDVCGAYVRCLKWSLILQGSKGKSLHLGVPNRIFQKRNMVRNTNYTTNQYHNNHKVPCLVCTGWGLLWHSSLFHSVPSLASNIMLFFTTIFLTLNHLYSIFTSGSSMVSNDIATDKGCQLYCIQPVVIPYLSHVHKSESPCQYGIVITMAIHTYMGQRGCTYG